MADASGYKRLDEIRRATTENRHDVYESLEARLLYAVRGEVEQLRQDMGRAVPKMIARECAKQLAKAFAPSVKHKAKKKRKRKAAQ